MRTIKFIDLFCGTGGIRLGMEQAFKEHGLDTSCILSSDTDRRVCETYELNFGENPYIDIHDVDALKAFDILLAGFPCQAFSYAGKQQGFADTRGTLFFELERIIRKHLPRLVFLENVRGLTTHDKGRTFKTIVGSLEKLGYSVQHRLLNSSNYGIPQNRTRIYIIATLGFTPAISLPSDTGASDSHSFRSYASILPLFGNPAYKHKVLKDVLEDNPPKEFDCSASFVASLKTILNGNLDKLHGIRLIDTRNGNSIHSWDIGRKGKCTDEEIAFMNALLANRRRHVFGVHQDGKALTLEQIKTFLPHAGVEKTIESLLSKGYLSKKSGRYNPVCGNMSFEVFKFLDPESISITLTAADAHKLGVYYAGRVRHLTPRECARIQGYPENYILHPTDQFAYKQLGNAVSVPVIKALFSDLLNNNIV